MRGIVRWYWVVMVMIAVAFSPVGDGWGQTRDKAETDTTSNRHIEELMEVMEFDEVVVRVITRQVFENVKNKWTEKNKDMKSNRARVVIEVMAETAWEDMRKDVIGMMGEVYGKYFTDEELVDLIAFYKTKAGMKTVRYQNEIMNDLSARVKPYILDWQKKMTVDQEYFKRFSQKVEERLKEMGNKQ